MNQLNKHNWRALLVLLVLAWLHGAQYALLLPPWGLIDEAQHLDYVVHLATQHRLPNAMTDLLSADIVQSLFTTNHWQTFQWPTPSTVQEVYASPVGHSYEAYQPPLYYFLMLPFMLNMPGDILVRLFGLRLVTVTLSLLPVYLLYRTTLLLAPDSRLALLVTFLLLSLPERTFAVSRVNNDSLVEVMGAGFCYVSTQVWLLGWTRKRAILLGLLLVCGVWAKLSMLFWLVPLTGALWLHRQPDRRHSLWSYAIAGIGILLLFGRNLLLYGDITGYGAFRGLYELPKPAYTLPVAVAAVGDLFKHLWVIWWKGASPEPNLFLNLCYLTLALLTIAGLAQLFRQLNGARQARQWTNRDHVLLFYLIAILIYAASILGSYYQGMVPTPQGRFWSPVLLPIILCFSLGLLAYAHGTRYLIGAIALLWILDTLALWGNLMPYYYYWSHVVAHHIASTVNWWETGKFFWSALTADKPTFVVRLLFVLVPIYWVGLLGVACFVFQQMRISPHNESATATKKSLAHPG